MSKNNKKKGIIKATKNYISLTLSSERKSESKLIRFTKSEYIFLTKKAKKVNTTFTKYCREKMLYEYRLEQYIELAGESLKKLILYFNNLKYKYQLDKKKIEALPKKLNIEALNAIQNYLYSKMMSVKREFLDLEQKILEKADEQENKIIDENLKIINGDEKKLFQQWLFAILRRNIEK